MVARQANVVLGVCVLVLMAAAGARAQESNIAASDFDGNGTVDFPDFLAFAGGFGKQAGQEGFNARLDLNGNGTVDFPDFLIFAARFGRTTSEPLRTYIYISDIERDGGKIEVIDPETNLSDPSRAIFLHAPRGIAFSSLNRQIYVAGVDTFYALSESGERIYEIPLVDPLPAPEGAVESRAGFKIALSPDGRFAFVTEEAAEQVEVMDLQRRQPVAQIPVNGAPRGILITPDGREVFVANGGLSVIDAAQHTLTDTVEVGNIRATRLAMAPDGARLYLNDALSGRITVVDPSTRAVTDSLNLGDTADLVTQVLDVAVSGDGATLYATVNHTIQGFDLQGNRMPIFSGTLVVIDAVRLVITDEIAVGELAANLGVSPDGKTAYVTGIESLFAQPPIIQVFIVDLEAREKVGSLRGFSLPVAIEFRAGKPVLNATSLPEITVF